jgi:hypothetical protein
MDRFPRCTHPTDETLINLAERLGVRWRRAAPFAVSIGTSQVTD